MRPVWWLTKDSDLDCAELYERHYSRYRYADGRARDNDQFVGPGRKLVLRTERGDAVFAWREFIDDSGQDGFNCAVFRNESQHRSSDLIRQADTVADVGWGYRRHYTYVDPKKVRSTNPGFCFIAAGALSRIAAARRTGSDRILKDEPGSVMFDIFTKLAILLDLIGGQFDYWKREIWPNDLDRPYCCSGRECGCMGQTNRDIFRPTSRTGADHG